MILHVDSQLQVGNSVSLVKYLIHTLVERRQQVKKSTTMEIFHSFVLGKLAVIRLSFLSPKKD